MYGIGFIAAGIGALALCHPVRMNTWIKCALAAGAAAGVGCWAALHGEKSAGLPPVSLAGIQMEFPPEGSIPKLLNRAWGKAGEAQIFVLSEYSLAGPVPETVKAWCREHRRYLVIGGEEPVGTNGYYNTAFVVGTNGEVVFQQAKCAPIQFFSDGLRAPQQKVWDSPWGKVGVCICYDLSYTRVTDELVRQGAQLLIVPTMDVEAWGRHEHALHTRVAPVRAAEYGIPVFRLASSGISQAVDARGRVVATAPMPGSCALLTATLLPAVHPVLPWDRFPARICAGLTGVVLAALMALAWWDAVLAMRAARRRAGSLEPALAANAKSQKS